MRAAILETIPGDLVIDDVTLTAPGPDEVLVRNAACGLCHSDLHVMENKLPMPPPVLLGHEAAGVVTAVGSDVAEFVPGDHVVACLSAHCNTCSQCTRGRSWLCEQRRELNVRADGTSRVLRGEQQLTQMSGLGGFAEEMLVHRNAIVKVTDDLPLELGALLGCAVITGVGSVFNGARVRAGSTVAVIGVGGVGLNIVQGAWLAGAERVIAVDLNPAKLALARSFGATDTVNGAEVDAVAAVVEMTSGGVDYAFEAIGLSATVVQAVQMVRPGCTAYLVGLPAAGATIEVPGAPMVFQHRGLQGLFMGANRFKRDIPMLANLYLQGRLKLAELVSARITLDEINTGFESMRKSHRSPHRHRLLILRKTFRAALTNDAGSAVRRHTPGSPASVGSARESWVRPCVGISSTRPSPSRHRTGPSRRRKRCSPRAAPGPMVPVGSPKLATSCSPCSATPATCAS